MTPRDRRLLLTLAAVTAAWLAGIELAGFDAVLLHFAPFLLLLVLLASGRYPGEELIAAALGYRARRQTTQAPLPRPRIEAPSPRGGRLLAYALAGRAPPRARCAQTAETN